MDFIVGKSENHEIPFVARTIHQYGSTVYQKIQNCNILGVMFSKIYIFFFFKLFMRKSWFWIFEITMDLHCNLKNLKSWLFLENIEKINFCFNHLKKREKKKKKSLPPQKKCTKKQKKNWISLPPKKTFDHLSLFSSSWSSYFFLLLSASIKRFSVSRMRDL